MHTEKNTFLLCALLDVCVPCRRQGPGTEARTSWMLQFISGMSSLIAVCTACLSLYVKGMDDNYWQVKGR